MKLSLNWVKDYVEIPSNLELSRIAHDLTMSTVEVEGFVDLSKKFENMVVGVIKEVLPHPNASKLRVCKVDLGNNNVREIVCGGSNLEKEMKVAVACPGSFVKWHGEGDLVEIKVTELRGVESYGMICASSEIGLFDLFPYENESEIMDLSQFNVSAGTPLSEALNLNDTILEIDNKSLTNRPDLWGHYGIAREISALYNLPLKQIKTFEAPKVSHLNVNIENDELCNRYIGVKIENVKVDKSPYYIQTRLFSVGMRPINSIVDITNYIMLSVGQPSHAFDFNNLKGDITVRSAKNSEKLLVLGKKELSLTKEDLVIADNESAIGLAGVIGGEKSSISQNTNNIVLEIANFNSKTIRKMAVKHDCRTESSMRNEKGIDANRCDLALSLAMELFNKLFPQMKVTAFSDNIKNTYKENKIDISMDWLLKRLGKNLLKNEVAQKLELLGFIVEFENDIMHLTVPSWRSTGDISMADDIIEEVARMYGFEYFEAKPITTTFEKAINQVEISVDRKIREYLAFRNNMNEIYTYPWINDVYLKAILGSTDGMLSLSAPPSPNEKFVRSSLLPNICKAVSNNLRYFDEFSIFESAQVFSSKEFKAVYDPNELLPQHRKNVAGAYVGSIEKTEEMFRLAKGMLEELPRVIHSYSLTFEKLEKPVWADNIVWLNVIQENKKIGSLALLSRKSAIECGIKNSAVVLFELDIESLKLYPSRTNKFNHLKEYPITNRDLSLLFDASVKWQDIKTVIKNHANELLQDIVFVDEYKGKQVTEGKKSLTIKLVIGSLKKTLTSNEIEECTNSIVKCLKENFNTELR